MFNRYGFLFDSCKFTAEAGASGVFLGASGWRRATRGDAGMPVGKMIVRNSTWARTWRARRPGRRWARAPRPQGPDRTTPVVVYTSDDYFPPGVGPTPAEPFLGEYRNSGPGAHQ